MYRRTWDWIVASPFAVADRFEDDSRGWGTTRTGVALMAGEEMRAFLGLPDDVHHATTIPTAYFTGTTFRRARRIPLDDAVHSDRWPRIEAAQ
jgi:hypothetical protein